MPNQTCPPKLTFLGHEFKKLAINSAKTGIVSSVCGISVYSLLMNIFYGKPEIVAQVADILAQYQVPAVVVPVALIVALHGVGVEKLETVERMARASISALGVASFFIPLSMAAISEMIRLFKDQPADSPVYISSGLAATIIGTCFTVGGIKFIQNNFLLLQDENPSHEISKLEKIATHKAMTILFEMITLSSTFHAASYLTQGIRGVDMGEQRYTLVRTGAAAAGALVGLIPGIAPHTIPGKAISVANIGLLLYVLVTNLYFLFTSPTSQAVLGEDTLLMLEVLMASTFALPTLLTALKVAGMGTSQLLEIGLEQVKKVMEFLELVAPDAQMDLEANFVTSYNSINYSH